MANFLHREKESEARRMIQKTTDVLTEFDRICCCSVSQTRPTLCDPMDCSTPGLPVLYHLPEFAQVHVHWVGDSIQPSHIWQNMNYKSRGSYSSFSNNEYHISFYIASSLEFYPCSHFRAEITKLQRGQADFLAHLLGTLPQSRRQWHSSSWPQAQDLLIAESQLVRRSKRTPTCLQRLESLQVENPQHLNSRCTSLRSWAWKSEIQGDVMFVS